MSMTIDRQFGSIIIVCDSEGCPSEFKAERGADFTEAWDRAKRDGWRSRKIANEWIHGCPDCGAPT